MKKIFILFWLALFAMGCNIKYKPGHYDYRKTDKPILIGDE